MSGGAAVELQRIAVEVDASRWSRFGEARWRASLESVVQRRVGELADDLALEHRPAVRFAATVATIPGSLPPFRARIDGWPCRIDARRERAPASADAEQAGGQIAEALYFNRQLLADHPAPGQYPTLAQYLAAAGLPVAPDPTLQQAWPAEAARGSAGDYYFQSLLSPRFARTVPVLMSPQLYGAVMGGTGGAANPAKLQSVMRDGLFLELGVRFPEIEFKLDEELIGLQFRAQFNRLRGPLRNGIGHDEVLVSDSPQRLQMLDIQARPAMNPATRQAYAVVRAADVAACESAGCTTWRCAEFVILQLSCDLRRHAPMFVTITQCERALHLLNEAFPMLVFNALERYGVAAVRDVLSGLVEDEVSIRDLRSVLEALLEIDSVEAFGHAGHEVIAAPDTHPLYAAGGQPLHVLRTSCVRAALQRQICHKASRGASVLLALSLSPQIEQRLASAAASPLDASERTRLVEAVAASEHFAANNAFTPAMLTHLELRAPLRELLALEFPDALVLARQELGPEMRVEFLGEIDWPRESRAG